MGKVKVSPRKSLMNFRPTSAKGMVTSLALNRATRALSSVNIEASVQRGNIKVVVRVRPPNARETTANSRVVVHAVDSHMVLFDPPDGEGQDFYFKGVRQNYPQKTRHKNTKMAFDNVYGPSSTNVQIFDDVIRPMLDTLLSGYNCSVFAYGATGSGKTHTMLGSRETPGLTFQTVMELYKRLGDMESDYETEVTVSYLEVYNEAVKDLLSTSSVDLQIREDSNGIVVPGLSTHRPKDSTELLELLAHGNSVRSQHPTDHNAESSRSHAVFQVFINLRSRFTELTNKYKSSKLVMVDLAGSEKGAATGFQGQRFREGASINKSLLSLGNCINALADGKKHIPYRDSKLTRILKDSLGGNCKTVMIANVSPSSLSYDDSYNTLRYADRAKRIKFQVKKNTMSVSACLTQYTKVVEEMSHKIEQLQSELAEVRKNCSCKTPKAHASTQVTDQVPGNQINALPPPSLSFPNENGGVDMVVFASRQAVAPHMLHRLHELNHQKEETVKTLCQASSTASSVATRIGVKERRIKSIKKLNSSREDKNTYKIKRQLRPLHDSYKEALQKKTMAHEVLEQLDEEMNAIQKHIAGADQDNQIPMKMSDFFELQNLKIEQQKTDLLKKSYQNICTYYLEEWQKSESLLGNSMDFLSSQYLLNKHYKNTTTQMDLDYDGLVANLCGTKVMWSKDMDVDDDSTVPYLKKFLDDKFLLEVGTKDLPPTPQHNPRTYFATRVPTPPRLKFTATNTDDEEDIEVDMQDSFVSNPTISTSVEVNEVNDTTFQINDNDTTFQINDTTFQVNDATFQVNDTTFQVS